MANDRKHAADHVDGALDAVDQIFAELGETAAAFRERANREATELRETFKLADASINDRMATANQRFRRFLGSNNGPRVEDRTNTIDGVAERVDERGRDETQSVSPDSSSQN